MQPSLTQPSSQYQVVAAGSGSVVLQVLSSTNPGCVTVPINTRRSSTAAVKVCEYLPSHDILQPL